MNSLLKPHYIYASLYSALMFVLTYGANAIPVLSQTSSLDQQRTLEFNSEKPLGTLSLMKDTATFLPARATRKPIATAYKKVSITVPAGQLVCFEPNQLVLKNPALLKSISANSAIDALMVQAIELESDSSVVCDKLMPYINKIKSLRQIYVDRSDLTDAGLSQLTNLNNLEVVSISFTGVQGTGLAILAKMPNVHALNLLATDVTNESMKNLRPLHKLTYLNINETHLSKPTINELSKQKTLKELHAGFNYNIDDACMPAIGSIDTLETLDLRKTSITDKGLKSLLTLHHLGKLDLRDADVTPRGLSQLQPLHLKFLIITDHHYSPEQLQAIHQVAQNVITKGINVEVDKATLKLFAPVSRRTPGE